MSDQSIQRLKELMLDNGYQHMGAVSFRNLSTGSTKSFLTWGEVYDFVRATRV